MRLSARRLLIVYYAVIHVVLGVMAFFLLRDRWALLFTAEALFLLSLWIGYRLIRGLFVPVELIRTGTELIEEGEYTTHFRPVGLPEFDRLLEVYNAMVDRLGSERVRVREQNEFLDRLVDASPGGIVVCDFDGQVASINPAACAILGVERERALGQPPQALPVLGELAELEGGASRVLAQRAGRRLRGTRGEFRDRGFQRSFFLLEELTEELRRSEKEAYGKLIRMISHEVNNSVGPVSSLVDSISLYAGELPAGDRERFESGLSVASGRLDHLRAFVEGFAEVVRLPEPKLEACNVDRVLAETLELLEPILSDRNIECVWQRRELTNSVAADKNQIEQVFLNVLQNAIDAIDRDGEIRLRTSAQRSRVEIEDTGPGLSPEAELGVFHPFFTTKSEGRGLGLTITGEILSRHGFPYALENAPAGGAVFSVEMVAERNRNG